jgi:hypothetical protein
VEDGLRQEGIALRPRGAAAADGFALEQRYRQRLEIAEQEGVRRRQATDGKAVRQYRVAQGVHLMSPGFAFQYAVEALLGTGLPKYQHFERQAWAYRETLRAFIRGRDAVDPGSPHLLFLPGYLSDAPLEGRQVPRFQEERLPLGESVSAGWAPLLVLVIEAGGAFFGTLWVVSEMDLTD